MPLPHARVPLELLVSQREFIDAHKPNLEIYLSGKTLDAMSTHAASDLIKANISDGSSITLHGPFMDLSPGAVDSRVREVTRQRFLDVIDVAGRTGALAVVLHSGYEKWRYELGLQPWLDNSLAFWPEILKAASDAGVRVAIENIFEEDPENLMLLMEGLDSNVAGICFDAGHFNIFSKLPLLTWMDYLGQYIIEFHLHDNMGDADSHLPPGDGSFDFKSLFQATRGKDIIWTIEANSPEETLLSIDRLRAYL